MFLYYKLRGLLQKIRQGIGRKLGEMLVKLYMKGSIDTKNNIKIAF